MADEQTARGLGSGNLDAATEKLTGLAADAVATGNEALAAVAYASLAVAHARGGRRAAAEDAVGRAFDLARRSEHLGAKVMVSWRYVAMLNALDRPAEARRYADSLLAELREDDPLEIRREAHQVSADVAAACGDWHAVRRHSLAVAALATDDASARAQGLVGAANAALREGHHEDAARDAQAALHVALAGELDSLRAAALATLMDLGRVPEGIDVDAELRSIASRASLGGDSAGETAARLSLGRWHLDHGNLNEAKSQLDGAAAAAQRGGHTFAWGKILILRAATLSSVQAAVDDVGLGWRTLNQIVDTFTDPAGRQTLLVDWRAMTDAALTALPSGPDPLNAAAADLAVRIFDSMAVDAVREKVLASRGQPPKQPSGPANANSCTALRDLRTRTNGRAVLAFRVLRAEHEHVSGWRLSIDEAQAVRLEPFEVTGAPAFELKLLAERDPTAPTDAPALWLRLAAHLLPSTWEFTGGRLIIVPHGPLWLVPWAALRINQHQWLVERSAVTLAPSLTSLPPPSLPRPARTESVVIAIDPRMKGGVADAAHVKSRLGDRAVVVTDAARLRAELAFSRDLLIVSAHGNGAGAQWEVELEAGQRLTGADIAELRLPALVVAASCLSGRQSFEPWPPTLVTSCIANGVASLVAGLWDLPDDAASQLIAALTDSLIGTNLPVDLCLQAAQAASARAGASVREWAGLAVFSGYTGAPSPT